MSDKKSVSKVTYGEEGQEFSNTPSGTAYIVRHTFADGYVDDFDTNKASVDIRNQAMLRGFNEKLHNAFASAKGNVQDAIEMYLTVKENLENGLWSTKREGSGPRISILAQAVEAALIEAGQEVDDTRKLKIMDRLRTEEGRDVAKNDAVVNKHYDRIRLEAMQAKAKESAAAAKGQKSALADF